jgi:hypothetical protein
MTTAERVNVGDILSGALDAATREAEAAEAARDEAFKIYDPIQKAAQRAEYLQRKIHQAAHKWETGGDLSWQAVAGVCKRMGLINSQSSGTSWKMTEAQKEASYRAGRFTCDNFGGSHGSAVRLSVSPGPATRNGHPTVAKTDEERKLAEAKRAIWEAECRRIAGEVKAQLEKEGYVTQSRGSSIGYFIVSRGPALVASIRAERGITPESILVEAGLKDA